MWQSPLESVYVALSWTTPSNFLSFRQRQKQEPLAEMLAIESSLSPVIWDQLGQRSEACQKQWVYSAFTMYFLSGLESVFLWSTERKQARAWRPVSEHAPYTRLKVMVITGVGQPNVYTTQPHSWALEAGKTNGSPWTLETQWLSQGPWILGGTRWQRRLRE